MSDLTTTSEPTPTDPVFQPPDPAQLKADSPGASAPSETAVDDDGTDLEAARKLRSEARNLRARQSRIICLLYANPSRNYVGEVHLGALDGPDAFVPTYELWCVRREGWLPDFPGTVRFDRDRDG